jgi:Major Facilitator Superfamily
MIFFLTQFLQDVQGHSALLTGIGFLPTPTSVFVSSQVTSRWLVGRVPAKILMLSGSIVSAAGLLIATQLSASTPYLQILVTLILIGTGMGISFVSLTSAGLHDVDPADAGAASGLVNVMQQVGAALGLAVLVTVFDSVVGPLRNGGFALAALHTAAGLQARAALVHGIDVTFAAGTLFALAAVVVIATVVRVPSPAIEEEIDMAALASEVLVEIG